MGLKNTTTTLVQSFGSTEARLVRVEVLVLFSFLAWVLLELFGSYRRRYGHWFFRLLVWTVYTLSTVLAPYTTGLLQAGPFRDQTFVLWGTILLLIQVSSDSLSVYSIQDIEQKKRMLVQQVLQIFLVLWLIVNGSGGNRSYSATTWMFWVYSIILACRKFGALSKASKKGGLVKHSKVIADYMVDLVEQDLVENRLDDVNPATMKGYKYIFYGEAELASRFPTAPEYRVGSKEVNRDNWVITIDSVWQWIDTYFLEPKESAETYKDVALSFTLVKLLKRRFCGYPLREAGLDKTLNLVLDGLLSEKDKYVRAFRVIELELTFLYDFFYTRMDTGYIYWTFSAPVILTVVVWNSISGAFSKHYHRSNLEQIVNGADIIRWITIVLLATLVFVYIMGILRIPERVGVIGNICSWLRKESTKPLAKGETSCPKVKDTWERKLGQYSLLHNFDYDPWNALSWLSLGLIEATRKGQKAGKKIKLEEEVIIRVLSRFKENRGKLKNGESALASDQLRSQFSWACSLRTPIHTILVWHIATTMCGCEASQEPLKGDRLVAQSLSEYCAYLVAFVPDMLPGHGYDTRRIFDTVVMEARLRLDGCKTMSRICEKLARDLLDKPVTVTILGKGAMLGGGLRDMVPDERWKVLADFWAEFILFLAPSDNADIHAEMLPAGGEFMTHLWALLTHAGVLERPSSSSGVDPAEDFTV